MITLLILLQPVLFFEANKKNQKSQFKNSGYSNKCNKVDNFSEEIKA